MDPLRPLSTVSAGLMNAGQSPKQSLDTVAGLTGQFPRHYLCLIEAAISNSLGSGGGPGQDGVRMVSGRDVVKEKRKSWSEGPDHAPTTAKFQVSDERTGNFVVANQRRHLIKGRDLLDRRRGFELTDAGRTRRTTEGAATDTRRWKPLFKEAIDGTTPLLEHEEKLPTTPNDVMGRPHFRKQVGLFARLLLSASVAEDSFRR